MKTRDPVAMQNEYVIVDDCRCIRQTQHAILIACKEGEAWIPQRFVHDNSECYRKGTEGILLIPRWLAKDKGLAHRERGGRR